MKKIIFVFGSLFLAFVAHPNELQTTYAKALSFFNNGKYNEAYKLLDSVVTTNENVPSQFYVKTFDALNESFLQNQLNEKEFNREVKKYNEIVEKRQINDEKVLESFLYLLANIKDIDKISEICKKIITMDEENITASFFLIKVLIQKEKFDFAYNVGTRVLAENKINEMNYQLINEIKYLSLISKLYSRNLKDIEKLLSNFSDDEAPQIKYIIMNIYYTMMMFDKAKRIVDEGGVTDPETAIKIYMAFGDKDSTKKILNNYSEEIPNEIKELANNFINEKTEEIKNQLNSPTLKSDPMAMKLKLDISTREKNQKEIDETLKQISYYLFVQGRYNEAISYLERIKNHSDFSYYILGSCYMEKGDYKKALSAFSKVKKDLTLDSSIRQTFSLISLDNYNKARENLKKITKEVISKGNDTQKMLTSQISVELGDINTALKVLNSCSNKDTPDYKMNLGTIHFLKGDYTKSEEILKSVLKEDEYNIYAMNALAYLWATENENLEESLKFASISLFLEPEDYTLLDTKAFIYYKKGDIQNAKETITKALENMEKENRHSYEIYLHAGEIFLSSGDKTKAMQMLAKAKESYLKVYQKENKEIKSLMEK